MGRSRRKSLLALLCVAGLSAAGPVLADSLDLPVSAVSGVEAMRELALPQRHTRDDAFFLQPDAPIREALRHRPIRKVHKGGGGRSLGFHIVLEGGQEGYFKPEQTFSAANWFGEVAAYHLDRMLGIGRVPPVVSRELAWDALDATAGSDYRRDEIIVRDGKVRGAFVAWIPGDVIRMERQERWELWLRLSYLRTSAVTPFQRSVEWRKQTALAKRLGRAWRTTDERARIRNLRPEPVRAERPAELSDLIVFDYLTRNLDRWGGHNENVRILGAGGPLIFLDNGAGFEPGEVTPAVGEARLEVIERFRRSTIEAIQAFDVHEFERRLAAEDISPVLDRQQLGALETRRKILLDRVAALTARYGEAIWISD